MASLGRDGGADVRPVGGAAAAATEAYGHIYIGGTAAVGADGSGTCCSSICCCSGDRHACLPRCAVEGCGGSARIVSGRGIGGGTCSSAGDRRYCFPHCVGGGGAARAPASADSTAALTTAPATGGTVPSATSVGGAPASSAVAAASEDISATEPATSGTVPSAASIRGAVGGRESSTGAVSSDAEAEATPSTGGTAAPVASAARAARKLASAAGSAGDRWVANTCGERGASTHPFDPDTVFPLEVRYSSDEHGSSSNSSSGGSSGGSSSSSSNDNTSDHDSLWDTTRVGALLRLFDPGKRYRRSARRGKAVLGVDFPFDRGKEWDECNMEGDGLRGEGGTMDGREQTSSGRGSGVDLELYVDPDFCEQRH